jgi:hypothetical protein
MKFMKLHVMNRYWNGPYVKETKKNKQEVAQKFMDQSIIKQNQNIVPAHRISSVILSTLLVF